MVLMIKDATHNTTATAATATATSSSSSSGDTVYSAEHDSDTDADVAAPAAADGGENVASVPPAVLVLLTDEVRVDERAVAQHLGLPRRRLRLASRQEAAAATGYEVGSIPPFGECGASLLQVLERLCCSCQCAGTYWTDPAEYCIMHLAATLGPRDAYVGAYSMCKAAGQQQGSG
jgi:hypothetical protein